MRMANKSVRVHPCPRVTRCGIHERALTATSFTFETHGKNIILTLHKSH